MKKGSFNHSPKAQFRARELRADRSVSEGFLWERIRKNQLGFAFRTQVRVDHYFLDFYCAQTRLCVEVDGEQHALRKGQDARRDQVLRDLGIETMRIPSLDLFERNSPTLEQWIRAIAKRCQERAESPTPNPLPQRQTTLRDGAPEVL